MKKLLCSAAVCGLAAFAATPAQAGDGLTLDVGGFFKGYGVYTDQDDDPATGETRNVDIIRNTEVHFGGETTLDNGLTVGMHFETEADGNGTDSFDVQESYAYFSGTWGRANFGAEDGAAYLLQVEAPSADSNFDGLRQDVNPIFYDHLDNFNVLSTFNVNGGVGGLDYDHDVSGYADKLTYLSPIMNGFQAGLSYTPDVLDVSDEDMGNHDNEENDFGSVWEIAARYEAMFNNIGVILGAAYSLADLEEIEAGGPDDGDPTDDRESWNAGIDLDIGPFGVGAAYMHDNYGDVDTLAGVPEDIRDDEETWVVGVDYTTGPWKLGASYLSVDGAGSVTGAVGNDGVEAERWTGGVVYTYGPGMTFRGSVTNSDFSNVANLTSGDDASATSVLIGTQIDF